MWIDIGLFEYNHLAASELNKVVLYKSRQWFTHVWTITLITMTLFVKKMINWYYSFDCFNFL